MRERTGLDIEIAKICDKDLSSKRCINVSKRLLTKNPQSVINDKNIDIIAELIGGINPAKDILLGAIKNKKHIVTANKALLATCGRELFKSADKNGVQIYFEGSVGGGIPIVKALREGLVANRINTIYAIINGTSNFILTKMQKENCGLDEALSIAQNMGYAERNPALDISGADSAHKLSILALLGFGSYVNLKDIYTEGIEDIELQDLQYAKDMGYIVKSLAIAKKINNRLEVRVHPTLLKAEHLLSNISGVYNAIYLKSDLIKEALLYGEGAGQFAAASAVVSDIVDLAKIIASGGNSKSMLNFGKDIKNIKDMQEVVSRYYIRFSAIDRPGVLAAISGVLAKFEISIASVTQKERRKENVVPIVMMTHEALEKNMRKALAIINKLPSIKKKTVAIRVEN